MKFLLLIPISLLFLYEFKVGLLEDHTFIIHNGVISSLWIIISIISFVIQIPSIISLMFLGRGMIYFVCFINAIIVKKVTE